MQWEALGSDLVPGRCVCVCGGGGTPVCRTRRQAFCPITLVLLSLFSVLWNHLEVEALFYLFNQPTSLSLPDVELWNSGYFSQMCQSYFTRPWSNRVATVLGCGKGSEKQWLFHSLCGVQSLPSTDVWDWRRPSLILWKLDISLTLQWVHRCPTEWKSSWFQFVYSNAADFSRKH